MAIPLTKMRFAPLYALRRGGVVGWSILLLACGSPDPEPPSPVSDTAGGRPAAQRIVCLGRDLCALLVDLGLATRVVAADSRSRAIALLSHARDLGDAAEPSPEALGAVHPDLVLVLTSEVSEEVAPAEAPVHRFSPVDANGVVEAIHRVGRLTGSELRASALAARMSREVGEIAVRRDGLPRLRVAWVIERDPLVAVGGSGLLHEILELAGAENAFHTPADPRLFVTEPEIAARAPDRVLGLEEPADPAWSALPTLDLLGRVRALHARLYPDTPGDVPARP